MARILFEPADRAGANIGPYVKVRNIVSTATLTSKGQITIRAALGVDAGDRVEFVEVAPGRFEFIAATRSVTELKRMFGKRSARVSVADMNAAIARRGRGRGRDDGAEDGVA